MMEYVVGRVMAATYGFHKGKLGMIVTIRLGDLGSKGEAVHVTTDAAAIARALEQGRVKRVCDYVGIPVYAEVIDNEINRWRVLHEANQWPTERDTWRILSKRTE